MQTLIKLADMHRYMPATRKLVLDSVAVGCSHIFNLLEFPFTSGNSHKSTPKVKKFLSALEGYMHEDWSLVCADGFALAGPKHRDRTHTAAAAAARLTGAVKIPLVTRITSPRGNWLRCGVTSK